MTTSNGFAPQAPLYVRALRLRHLHIGGFVSFILFECMIAAGVLLALAELTSWWTVPVLPAIVAVMVKVNDMAIGGSKRARAQAQSAARGSSERASSTRVDSPDRDDEASSANRRTTTALDRAEMARGAGNSSGTGAGAAARAAGRDSIGGGVPVIGSGRASVGSVTRSSFAAATASGASAPDGGTAPVGASAPGGGASNVSAGSPGGARSAVGAGSSGGPRDVAVAAAAAGAGASANGGGVGVRQGTGAGTADGTAMADAGGSRTATRQAAGEPPAQRKKVGVIRISVPARDGGPHGAIGQTETPPSTEYGISPGSHVPPAPDTAGNGVGRDGDTGAHAAFPGGTSSAGAFREGESGAYPASYDSGNALRPELRDGDTEVRPAYRDADKSRRARLRADETRADGRHGWTGERERWDQTSGGTWPTRTGWDGAGRAGQAGQHWDRSGETGQGRDESEQAGQRRDSNAMPAWDRAGHGGPGDQAGHGGYDGQAGYDGEAGYDDQVERDGRTGRGGYGWNPDGQRWERTGQAAGTKGWDEDDDGQSWDRAAPAGWEQGAARAGGWGHDPGDERGRSSEGDIDGRGRAGRQNDRSWSGHPGRMEQGVTAEGRQAWSEDTVVGWDNEDAWAGQTGAVDRSQANWGDETVWGDRSEWTGRGRTTGRADAAGSGGNVQAAANAQAAGNAQAGAYGQATSSGRAGSEAERSGSEGVQAGSDGERGGSEGVRGGDKGAHGGDEGGHGAAVPGELVDPWADWDDETGWADQAQWGAAPNRSGQTGWAAGQAAWNGYETADEPDSNEPDEPARPADNSRPVGRDTTGGRHAQRQPGGRRRADDTGHFQSGRHAERSWRTDEDLTRQRTGGFNQGRFA